MCTKTWVYGIHGKIRYISIISVYLSIYVSVDRIELKEVKQKECKNEREIRGREREHFEHVPTHSQKHICCLYDEILPALLQHSSISHSLSFSLLTFSFFGKLKTSDMYIHTQKPVRSFYVQFNESSTSFWEKGPLTIFCICVH